jgi:DNA polymerase III alpha subunit
VGFLKNFVGYGFNKAHAAIYGVIAYQSAYLKYYFTVPFMSSVLNNEGGFYHTAAYIEEARRLGIRILPPDVNHSDKILPGEKIQYGLVSTGYLSLPGRRWTK